MVWSGYLKRQDNKKNKRYTIYSYSSSRLVMPRGSIVLQKHTIVGLFGCVQKQKQQQQKVIVRVNLVVTLSHLGTRLNYIIPEFGGGGIFRHRKEF